MKILKRAGAICGLSLIIAIFGASASFAALELNDTYPRDGGSGFQPVNMAVTLYFNEDVSAEANQSENNAKLHIRRKTAAVDEDGNEIAITDEPVRVLYHPDEEGKVLVLLESDLTSNTEYVFTMDSGFIATNDDVLEDAVSIDFKTRDVSNDGRVNMLLMLAMFGGILIFSRRSIKKAAEEEAAKGKKSGDKVNPYKEAKRTGKSVAEIVEKDEKRKEKERAKEERRREREEYEEEELEEELERGRVGLNRYRVGPPRRVSEGGSEYKSGKAAEAAAKRAAGTTNPKGKKGKKRKK